MKGKSPNPSQQNFLYSGLRETLNPKEAIYQLAEALPWDFFEESFAPKYSKMGQPAKPIRLMVALLLLKHLKNLSDEEVVEQWKQNPYYQYFSGEIVFQWKAPCDATDLVYFRKRIGKEGVEKILAASVALHGKKGQEDEVVLDTTVQEKNITFPTDTKLHKKIIDQCEKIAKKEGVKQRQSYKRTSKKLMMAQRFRRHPRTRKRGIQAARTLKTIAGRVVRELGRKLPKEALVTYEPLLDRYKQVLFQERKSKNKIYSLHEPGVYCMGKGKEDKRYEFGCKVAIASTKTSGILVGTMSLEENQYDGHTVEDALEQIERVRGKRPSKALVDRGYRGKKEVGGTVLQVAGAKRGKTAYEKRKLRKDFRRRAAIEPQIGHLKRGNRMGRNYLKGAEGDAINAMMAAAAFNLKKWMREVGDFLFDFWNRLFWHFFFYQVA